MKHYYKQTNILSIDMGLNNFATCFNSNNGSFLLLMEDTSKLIGDII